MLMRAILKENAVSWTKMITGAIGALALGAAAAAQDVGQSLDDFWDGVAENANTTAPRADIGQEGGYFTGGSLVVRAPQDRAINPGRLRRYRYLHRWLRVRGLRANGRHVASDRFERDRICLPARA